MKKYIATGWTVNDSDQNTKLLNHFSDPHHQLAQIKAGSWCHSTVWSSESEIVVHYSADDIALTLCGRPTIKSSQSDSYEAVANEQQLNTLVKSYRTHGYNFLKDINGSFSVSLFDARNNVSLLAVDRMGIEQMHYACISGALYFSTSLKSLSNIPGVPKNVLPQSIYNYFYFHCA